MSETPEAASFELAADQDLERSGKRSWAVKRLVPLWSNLKTICATDPRFLVSLEMTKKSIATQSLHRDGICMLRCAVRQAHH